MIKTEKNVSLLKKTTFHIGGLAEKIVYPETLQEVALLMKRGDVSFILGGGSNLLVSDAGVKGTALSLSRGFGDVRISERKDGSALVIVQSAAPLTKLSSMMAGESLSGLEFGFGIPGSTGGALKMNAGAYDGEMKNVVETVTLVTKNGEIETLSRDECGFDYRTSRFPDGSVIVEATMRLNEGEKNVVREKMKQSYKLRKQKQPLEVPSAGSIFKNPEGEYAGRLIEKAGLKGARVGDAAVSTRHANFIVNLGNAKAKEVLALMEKIEKTVSDKFGINLKREVKLVGEF